MSSIAARAPRAGTGGRPPGPSGLLRLVALVFWVVLPVLCVLGISRGIVTWTDHAHHRVPGIPGSFLVQNRSCSGSICQSSGTFVSADGNFTLEDVTGQSGWSQDSTHSVVYDPSTPDVIVPLGARWNPTAAITSIAGGTVLLGAWTWLVVGARRPPAAGGAPAFA